MNYLAHIYLSHGRDDVILGNFIADFISNKDIDGYDKGIVDGILLHRKIDSYTDNHKIIRKGTKRLRSMQGKYAPVVIDILYDHLLAKNWNLYSEIPLKDYSKDIYALFEKNISILPKTLQKRLPRMIAGDFLFNYSTESGLRFVFEQMDIRTKFPSNFVAAYDQLYEDWDVFNVEFNLFFADIIRLTKAHLNQ